jgi:hypothetical protein
LGLPAEQKLEAETLKQKLAAQSATPKASSSGSGGSPKAMTAPPDESASPSIEVTLEYLNQQVNSGFVPSTEFYVPGKFSLNDKDLSRATYLRWSRWRDAMKVLDEGGPWQEVSHKAGQCTRGIIGYSAAKPAELDADSVKFKSESGELGIRCKSYACWLFFGSCSGEPDTARRQMLNLEGSRVSNADHGLEEVVIQTNGNPEVAENVGRALRHLIKLLQALPQNQPPKDPFAK